MRQESSDDTTRDDAEWALAEPMLDEAIEHLAIRYRDALVLRYFQGMSMREVGATLGLSEDAAKQRVCRALDKMRGYFARRRVVATSATVGMWLHSSVHPAAPHVAQGAMALASTNATAASGSAIASWFGASKLAASVIVAVLVTGSIIIASHIVMAADPPDSSVAAHGSPAAPATRPIPADLTTPLGMLKSLTTAMKVGDLATVDKCLDDDGADAEVANAVRSLFHEQAAIYRLEGAWQTAFKRQMEVPGFTFIMFPRLDGGFETLFDEALETTKDGDLVIDGDSATFRINVPRTKLVGEGPTRIPELGRWSGARLVLDRRGGEWKLNLDRSITYIATMNTNNRQAEGRFVLRKQVNDALTKVFNEVAAAVADGTIASHEEAAAETRAAVLNVFQEAGVSGAVSLVLPAVGG